MQGQLSFDDVLGVRECSRCGDIQPLDTFPVLSGKKSRTRVCYACRKADWARNHQKYQNKEIAHRKRYYAANRERILATARAHREANPDYHRERKQRYNRENRAKVSESHARYIAALPPHERAALHRNVQGRRRARELGATADYIPKREIIALVHDAQCVYCGYAAQAADHVRPLFRGGGHTLDNLVPACQPCNSSKGARLLSDWVEQERVARAVSVSPKVAAEMTRLLGVSA